MKLPVLQRAEYKYNVAMSLIAFTALLTYGAILTSTQCTTIFLAVGGAYGAVNYMERNKPIEDEKNDA
jgi:hypothetical protein